MDYISGYDLKEKNMKTRLKEAEIKDPAILDKLQEFYEIQKEINQLSDRVDELKEKYKGFGQELSPMFESMKKLEDNIAKSEQYIITIQQHSYESPVKKYKKAYEYALSKLNEATRKACRKLEEEESTVKKIGTRFSIGKLDEESTLGKLKSYLAKAVDFFTEKISKYFSQIDEANSELRALASMKESKISLVSLYEDWKNLQPFGEQEWNRVNNIAKTSKQDDYLDGIMNSIKRQGYKATERQKNYVKMWLQSGKDGIQWGRKN